MFEVTFQSQKAHADPFNEVDLDVLFENDAGQLWRVPAFWHGEQKWTVRFAPPAPGEYVYRLESTDRHNADLNGHGGTFRAAAYSGRSPALTHGMLAISPNKRHFQYSDGTPFFWLGDTWWMGLSDRLSWEDFKRLTDDRKAKGFTVIQVVAGLVPFEEVPPDDPGFGNEGGRVWEAGFQRINPKYFDFADRRIQYLLEQGLTPAIVGAWNHFLKAMGLAKMKKHWRYLIARYGAYPVLWIAGGEVYDPPAEFAAKATARDAGRIAPWSEIVQYIRDTDPYHHPVSVHDAVLVPSLKDPSLTDYHLFQCDHMGWPAIKNELSRLHQHYDADPGQTKPIVIGEIGYEKLGETNLENFQRAAFWLAMVNGAAGFTYGANGTFEAYTPERPHRWKWSSYTWEEGMHFPGSYQLGIAAKQLRKYPWWELRPHPEMVTPHGPRFGVSESAPALSVSAEPGSMELADSPLPGGAAAKTGNFFLPYAACVPRRLRLIYIPYLSFLHSFTPPPTVHELELDVRYRAYFWDPIHGIRFDLGHIQRPPLGPVIYSEEYGGAGAPEWERVPARVEGRADLADRYLHIVPGIDEANVVASVEGSGSQEIGVVIRFIDAMNFVRAVFSPQEQEIFIVEKREGLDGAKLARTKTGSLGRRIHLTTEVRNSKALVCVTDGESKVTSSIVDLYQEWAGTQSAPPPIGKVGLWSASDSDGVMRLEVRASPAVDPDLDLERELYDASGRFRGELRGAGWECLGASFAGRDEFGRERHLLLDAYRPERLPYGQDWVLVLEAVDDQSSVKARAAR